MNVVIKVMCNKKLPLSIIYLSESFRETMEDTECVAQPALLACDSLKNPCLWFKSYQSVMTTARIVSSLLLLLAIAGNCKTHASINPFRRGGDLETLSSDCAENKLFVLAVLIYFVEYIEPPWIIIIITLLSGGVSKASVFTFYQFNFSLQYIDEKSAGSWL